ncbi:transcriptional regulator [Azospirillum thiophilum]|uniref:transcriptional regulator n=1 Tax=Azospirillum thiophilum TaxID=528244 RepID=UPI0009E4B5E0|nr:transcriptional regulator [Azospirillum thiophilum]
MLPIQLEMALAALGWGTRNLSAASKVSLDTIGRFKRGEALKEVTISTMRKTLEEAGIIFIDENGEGPGVRLTKDKFHKS